jgi:hypothetical protein
MSLNNDQILMQLKNLLRKMDLPSHRKSQLTPQNLKWLARNLAIRNGDHKDFEKAIELIKSLVRVRK